MHFGSGTQFCEFQIYQGEDMKRLFYAERLGAGEGVYGAGGAWMCEQNGEG